MNRACFSHFSIHPAFKNEGRVVYTSSCSGASFIASACYALTRNWSGIFSLSARILYESKYGFLFLLAREL
jgi:hypothetical protein